MNRAKEGCAGLRFPEASGWKCGIVPPPCFPAAASVALSGVHATSLIVLSGHWLGAAKCQYMAQQS
jgi:hypothetical protein